MRLTSEERSHLVDLSHATGRTTDQTARLVALGFAISGNGRFGDWAKITRAGLAHLNLDMTFSSGSRVATGKAAALKRGHSLSLVPKSKS